MTRKQSRNFFLTKLNSLLNEKIIYKKKKIYLQDRKSHPAGIIINYKTFQLRSFTAGVVNIRT